MAWLTGYSYRMAAPVAQPKVAGDRVLTIPFPGWFLKDQGHITESSYQDVHVTKADGTTELPCSLNGAKTALTVDFASMPQGVTTLYVYYGKTGASAPTAPSISVVAGTTDVAQVFPFNGEVTSESDTSPTDYIWGEDLEAVSIDSANTGTYYGADATQPISSRSANTGAQSGGTAIDGGFESYADEDSLSGTNWTIVQTGGTVRADTAQAAVGSKSARLYSGGSTDNLSSITDKVSSLTTDGAEYRWWARVDSILGDIQFASGNGSGGTGFFFRMRDGNIEIYIPSGRTGAAPYNTTGYHTVGTYAANTWYQFKVHVDFTNDTFTLWRRAAIGGAWTQLGDGGSSVPIPQFAAGVSASAWFCQCYNPSFVGATNAWVDDVRYSDTPITDTYTTTDRTRRLLLKPGEWALRKGTVSDAKLHLHCTSAVLGASRTLRAHRFRNTGSDSADGTTRHNQWVRTNWTRNENRSLPTWANRFYSIHSGAAIAWQTAGAMHANEIDSAEYVSSAALASGFATGYKPITLTSSWLEDWQDDVYSSGLLIKDSTETTTDGADDIISVTAPSQTNSPVLVITYSALDTYQLASRKLTTDTVAPATFSTQNRYCQIPDANQFAVMAHVNAEMKIDVFYIESGGRIHRACRNTYNSSRSIFNSTSPAFGLHYDAQTGRYWLGGNSETGQYLQLGYSAPYVPTAFTWVENTSVVSVKASFFPKNDVVYLTHGFYTDTLSSQGLWSRTYTRGTNTWSSATQLLTVPFQGTARTLGANILSGTAMTGAGTITLSGAATDYPASGMVIIGTELFWYTGKSGSTLTGVTRAMSGSTAAAHTAGDTIYLDRTSPTYMAMAYDAVNNRMAIVAQLVSAAGYSYVGLPSLTGLNLTYLHCVAFFYSFTNARWEDGAGNALSLPLDQRTEIVVTRTAPAYGMNLTALSDGSILFGFGESESDLAASTGTSGVAHWTNSRVNKLESGTWTGYDLPNAMEVKLTDVGSGIVVFTGVGPLIAADGSEKIVRSYSNDYGETWSSTWDVATHDFAQPADNSIWANNGLWGAGTAEGANLDGKSLTYAIHFANHGAITLDLIRFEDQAISVGLGSETDTGLAMTSGLSTTTGLADETDTGLGATPTQGEPPREPEGGLIFLFPVSSQSVGVGTGSETDTGLGATPRPDQFITTGLGTETDTGLDVTPVAPADQSVAVDLPVEVDEGLSIAGRAIGVGVITLNMQLPPGTVVGAYLTHQWRGHLVPMRRTGSYPGPVQEEQTVDAYGEVTFATLAPGAYVAWAADYPLRRRFFMVEDE